MLDSKGELYIYGAELWWECEDAFEVRRGKDDPVLEGEPFRSDRAAS